MPLSRTILRLLPALLALLLLAAVPVSAEVQLSNGTLIGAGDAPSKILNFNKRANSGRGDVTLFASYLDIDDEKDLRTLSASQVRFAHVRARPTASLRPCDPPAAPTHPSCAAPPTGPPHA